VSNDPVRVVVVEDSLVQRAHLVSVLEADRDIKVVGEASTVSEALDSVTKNRPDVVSVDIHIPGGGGHLLIEQIMARAPTPILVLSATVRNDRSASAIEALAAGALVALPKPAQWTAADEAMLRRTVRNLKRVSVIRHPRGRLRPAAPQPAQASGGSQIVAIAASTGGPAVLATILADLSDLPAPVLVVQHLHADFVDSFATWMNRVSALPVVVAKHAQEALVGHVYIAPGNMHLRLGAGSRIDLSSTPEAIHRPSADQLFRSVAKHAGPDGIGVILTGIGDDGARGLLAIAERGGHTFAQDEASCAVFGMPRAAGEIGAVQQFLDPGGIARAVRRLVPEPRA
jgi:two-component system, chemotaxis family, protein-glutamate methylesterase/glutaminase